jgi:hypothetical protein
MNVPLVVTSCGFHGGDLPSAMSFVTIKDEDKSVRLASIRKGRDISAIVLRLVEVEGKETEARIAIAPALLPAGAIAVEVDVLERRVGPENVRLDGDTLVAKLPAFGIVTAQIKGQMEEA